MTESVRRTLVGPRPRRRVNLLLSTTTTTTTMKRSASKFKGKTKGIEEHTFTFDPQMNRKWMMSRLAFIEYSGREYGPNAKASLKRGVKP